MFLGISYMTAALTHHLQRPAIGWLSDLILQSVGVSAVSTKNPALIKVPEPKL